MNATASKRLRWILSGLESRGIDYTTASTYGEPGYSTEHPAIIFADWNQLDKGALDAIESVAEIEWSDEWTTDDGGRAFRTSPDCYQWEPAWFEHDGEIIPWDTLPEEGEDLAEALRDYGFTAEKGDTDLRALPSHISPERLRTIATLAADDYEAGYHPGQTDTPEKALAALPPGTYVFRISGKGQFDVHFEAWRLTDT